MNNEKLITRDRDIIFTYTHYYKELLEKKGTHVEFEQAIPVDQELFHIIPDIKSDNNIVFIGSYYPLNTLSKEVGLSINELLIYQSFLNQGKLLTKESMHKHSLGNGIQPLNQKNIALIMQAIIRNTCVEWMCEVSESSQIYGRYFDQNPKTKKQFNNEVAYGDDLVKTYNQHKYALIPSYYITSQRLVEAAACGCIPVVYDTRNFSGDTNNWDDYCLFFKSKEELNDIISNQKTPKKDPIEIAKQLSYETLAQKFVDIVENKLQKGAL